MKLLTSLLLIGLFTACALIKAKPIRPTCQPLVFHGVDFKEGERNAAINTAKARKDSQAFYKFYADQVDVQEAALGKGMGDVIRCVMEQHQYILSFCDWLDVHPQEKDAILKEPDTTDTINKSRNKLPPKPRLSPTVRAP